MLVERAFDEAFFFDCFFLAFFFGAIARFGLADFFVRFEAEVFDFVRLLFVFFLLEGIGAVYHCACLEL